VATSAPPGRSHVVGLRCRACGQAEEIGPNFVCTACFGPLEVVYDYDVARSRLTREAVAARPPGIWRYLELLRPFVPAVTGSAMQMETARAVARYLALWMSYEDIVRVADLKTRGSRFELPRSRAPPLSCPA
jgi:hypothetical protein